MIDSLIRQLHSPDPAVRKRAILAVGRAKNPAAVKHLAFLVKHDPDPELRDLARKAGQYIRQEVQQQTRPHTPLTATAVLRRRVESRSNPFDDEKQTPDESQPNKPAETTPPPAAASRPKSLLSALSESPANLPPARANDAQSPSAQDSADELFSEFSDETVAHQPLPPNEQVDQLFQEFGTQLLGQRPPSRSVLEPVEDTPVDDLVNRLLAEFGTGTLGPLPGEQPAEAAQAPAESLPEADTAADLAAEAFEDFTQPTLLNVSLSAAPPAPDAADAVDEMFEDFSRETLLDTRRSTPTPDAPEEPINSGSDEPIFEDFSWATLLKEPDAVDDASADPVDDLFEDFSRETLLDVRHASPAPETVEDAPAADPVDDLFEDFSRETLLDVRNATPSDAPADPVDDLFEDFSRETLLDVRNATPSDAPADPVDDLFEDFSRETLLDVRNATPSDAPADPVDDLFEDFSRETLLDVRHSMIEPDASPTDPLDDLFEDFSRETLLDVRRSVTEPDALDDLPEPDPLDDPFEALSHPTLMAAGHALAQPSADEPADELPVGEPPADDLSVDFDDLFAEFNEPPAPQVRPISPRSSSPFVDSAEEEDPDFAASVDWLAADPLADPVEPVEEDPLRDHQSQDDDLLAELLHLPENSQNPASPVSTSPFTLEEEQAPSRSQHRTQEHEGDEDEAWHEDEPAFTLYVEHDVKSNFTPYISPFTDASEDEPLETDYYQHIEVDLFPEQDFPEPELEPEPPPQPVQYVIEEKPNAADPADDFTIVRGRQFDIPKEDQARAKAYLNAAMSLNISGDNARALKNLTSALGLNPNLINDGYFNNVAEAITDLTGDKAAQVIIDRTRRTDFTKNAALAQKARRKEAHVKNAKQATWTDVWFEVIIYALIVIIGPVLAVLVTVESARNLLGVFSEVSSELPPQLQNAQVLSEAFSLSSLLPIGIVSGISGVISLLLVTVLVNFMAKLLGGAGTWRNLIRILLGFFNKWLPILFFLLYITIAVTFISVLSPIILCFVLVLVGLSLYVSVKTAGKIGEAYDFGAGKGCLAYLISLLVIGLINGGIYYVLGQSMITALSAVTPGA